MLVVACFLCVCVYLISFIQNVCIFISCCPWQPGHYGQFLSNLECFKALLAYISMLYMIVSLTAYMFLCFCVFSGRF